MLAHMHTSTRMPAVVNSKILSFTYDVFVELELLTHIKNVDAVINYKLQK